jgi:hypothetical protein
MTDPRIAELEVPEGPYMNEDGDWWVPVEGIAFRKARELVLGCLYDVPRLAYLGKEMQWLDSEHEFGCIDPCPSNRRVLAYHFEERRDD